MREVVDILLLSASNAFIQVGVFVGALLLLFGYINYKKAGAVVRWIERRRKWQPLVGALMGVSPGCGGAIFLMPLYLRGVVSFGTLVATLIATMGDSSFVIIAQRPLVALLLHGITFVVGVACGYLVDGLGFKVRRPAGFVPAEASGQTVGPGPPVGPHIGHEAGDPVGRALHPPGLIDRTRLSYRVLHQGYWLFWIVALAGFILGALALGQVGPEDLGGVDLWFPVGFLGTVLCLGLTVLRRHVLRDDIHAEHEEKLGSLRETFIHNAAETAFVTTWVFVALSTWELFLHFSGMSMAQIAAAAGVWSVITAAMIGLIPGCGPQIVLVTLYVNGAVPFAAVLANAISQDGDALFPILAMDRRAAVAASVVTTIPAIVLGLIVYFVSWPF